MQARRRQGPLPPPALPGFISTMAPSDFRSVRLPHETCGSLSRRTGSPLSPVNPSPACCCHYPGGPDGCICRSFPIRWSLPRDRGGSASTTSVFEACSAFTRYGLPDRSTAHGGLCHEASTRQSPTDSRSSASEPNRLRLVWSPHPTGSTIVSGHTPSYAGGFHGIDPLAPRHDGSD